MKRLLVAVVVAALLVPAAATAKEGPEDTLVAYTPAPVGLKAGQAWSIRFWFHLRNGSRLLISGLRPSVTIRNAATGAARVFFVKQDNSKYYSTRVVFPAAGTWTVTFRFDYTMRSPIRRLTTIRVF
jgi:hypothetical protein